MNIPFDKINKELEKQLGEGIDLRPCDWNDDPYMLHFEDDNVLQETINLATKIVDSFLPTLWNYDEIRKT